MAVEAEILERYSAAGSPPGLGVSLWTEFNWLRKDFLKYLERTRSVGSNIVRLKPLPFNEIYLITSFEVAREITGPLAPYFQKSSQTRMMVGKFLGSGLVLSEGERHLRDRKVVSKLFAKYFSSERIGQLCHSVLTEHVKKRGVRFSISDIEAFWARVSFEIIGKGVFGEHAFGATSDLFAGMAAFAESMGNRFKTIPLPEWLPTSRNRHERAAINNVNRALIAAYDECNGDTFAFELKRLLASDKESRQAWVDQIKTLLFAGHETVAKLLSWSIYFLCSDELLYSPLKDHLRAGNVESLTCFINEVLRMRPPVWVFDRASMDDVEVAGFVIPKGKKVYISPYLFHHDTRYFSTPSQFLPERFRAGDGLRGFMPFGEGVRSCVGKQLALAEAKCLLRLLIEGFDLRWCRAHCAPRPKAGATLGFDRTVQVEFRKID